MKRLVFLLIAGCLLLLLLLPAAALADKPTIDQAIDQLFTQGYPQAINSHVAAMGTNPVLGFRWAGTWSDDQAARYLAQEARKAGLKNVHLEPVPVDEFNFIWADVKVGDRQMIASSFAGIRPTSKRGLSGQVVYAKSGTRQDFDALKASGVSVKGKLVLIDADFTNWWCNDPAAEATYRGAKGIVFTYGPPTGSYYSYTPDTLGSFDSQFDMKDVSAVYIAKQDGDWLKSQLDAKGVGPVVRMRLIEKVRLADRGGRGYNVVGELPGRVKDGTFVLFDAHHDAHFHSACDDITGCTVNMAIAKAMVMSGYRPKYTMRFMFVTAEEFGYTNSYNDWCIGAWWAITRAHPDWAGRIRGFINNDQLGGNGPLTMVSTPEWVPWLNAEATAASGALPGGFIVKSPNSTWNDSWTFTAAGVQAVTVSSDSFPDSVYHTQYMTDNWNNWPVMGEQAKFMAHIADGATNGLLPYDLKARADELAGKVDATALTDVGASPAAVTRLVADITAFQAAAADYEARVPSIQASHYWAVNKRLLKILKITGIAFTGQNAWQMAIYPHEQALLDVQSLEKAIAALKLSTPDTGAALDALPSVVLAAWGRWVDDPVYRHLLHRLDPTYYRAAWGEQGHALTRWELFDVVPQYDAIQGGTWGQGTIDQLQTMVDTGLKGLNKRLNAMSRALEYVTPQVEALH